MVKTRKSLLKILLNKNIICKAFELVIMFDSDIKK